MGVRAGASDRTYWSAPAGRATAAEVSRTSSSRRREAKKLSTPKKASPSGASLVRTSLLVNSPASPEATSSRAQPVSFWKALTRSSGTEKVSWVTTVTVLPSPPAVSPPASLEPQAASARPTAVAAPADTTVRRGSAPDPPAEAVRRAGRVVVMVPPGRIPGGPGRGGRGRSRVRGDSTRLPSPVLAGSGSRVCGRPHSQHRGRRSGTGPRPRRRRALPCRGGSSLDDQRPGGGRLILRESADVVHESIPRRGRRARRFVRFLSGDDASCNEIRDRGRLGLDVFLLPPSVLIRPRGQKSGRVVVILNRSRRELEITPCARIQRPNRVREEQPPRLGHLNRDDGADAPWTGNGTFLFLSSTCRIPEIARSSHLIQLGLEGFPTPFTIFPVGILVDEDGVDRPGSLLSRDRISDVIHPAAHRLARSPSGQRRRIFDDLDVIRVIHPRSQGRDERLDRLRVITIPTRLSLSAFTEDKNDRAPPSQRSALRRGLRSTRAPPRPRPLVPRLAASWPAGGTGITDSPVSGSRSHRMSSSDSSRLTRVGECDTAMIWVRPDASRIRFTRTSRA